MARRSLIVKEKKKNLLYKKYRDKLIKLKNVIKSKSSSNLLKWKTMLEIQKFPRNSSITRKRNRCLITGRARGVFRYFKLCRHVIKDLALKGYIPGLFKASW